ncbi:MAG TPA: hypothetical protein VGO93_04860 [Candidatus Xenobia bacterium]
MLSPFETQFARRLAQLARLQIKPTAAEPEPLTQYAMDPTGFCRDVLGLELWAAQVEIAESVRDNPRTAVAACFSSGKTYSAAALLLYWVHTRRPAMVISTAPTGRQVKQLLWRNIKKLMQRARRKLPGRLMQLQLEISPDWWAMGFSSDNPTAVQGLHEARNVLFIEDEAAGMDPDVVEAFAGITAAPNSRHLKIGNPTTTSGPFYDAFHKDADRWNLIHIDAEETPNVLARREIVPGLVTFDWVEDVRRRWGESSPHWITKVKGQFHTTSGEKVIPMAWVQAAQDRWDDVEDGKPRILGVDVGRSHDDTVICLRTGRRVRIVDSFHGESVPDIADRVAQAIKEYEVEAANIDATGIGIGVFDTLLKLQNEKKLPSSVDIADIVFSRSPGEAEVYERFIDELCWQTRLCFDPTGDEAVALDPEDTELAAQLTLRDWVLTDKGRIKVDAKKTVIAKTGKSPDRADAVMLALRKTHTLYMR